jgi:hypothetical protein
LCLRELAQLRVRTVSAISRFWRAPTRSLCQGYVRVPPGRKTRPAPSPWLCQGLPLGHPRGLRIAERPLLLGLLVLAQVRKIPHPQVLHLKHLNGLLVLAQVKQMVQLKSALPAQVQQMWNLMKSALVAMVEPPGSTLGSGRNANRNAPRGSPQSSVGDLPRHVPC